ncbi:hypothetical protein EV359DRAFT_88273, partial [Lentinula novae-zelandiae]
MAQDDFASDEEWFGVAGSNLYELNDASAPSGEEGEVPFHRTCPLMDFSSPGVDGFHRRSPGPAQGPNPLELSPSVDIEDFAEVPLRRAPAVRDSHLAAPPRGPFRDSSLVPVSGHGLQPAPQISLHPDRGTAQRGRRTRSDHHHQSRHRARTREPSPGPDFSSHLRRSSRSLSPVTHYAPARFDPSSLRVGRDRGHHYLDLPSSHVSPYILDQRAADQRVPVKNGHRFRDPRQGKISSTVPTAMLNQIHPLVISALRTGWPAFISLNYFSRRMSEAGESTVSAGGETWDVDDAGQVKFKTKCLKEMSFESISRWDWDSISKNMPRALMDYFIPPGECGIGSELAYEIAQ